MVSIELTLETCSIVDAVVAFVVDVVVVAVNIV